MTADGATVHETIFQSTLPTPRITESVFRCKFSFLCGPTRADYGVADNMPVHRTICVYDTRAHDRFYQAASVDAICSRSLTHAQLSSSGKSEMPDWKIS